MKIKTFTVEGYGQFPLWPRPSNDREETVKTYWHEVNPWWDRVVYVPIELLAECAAGGRVQDIDGKTKPYDVAFVLNLDTYILLPARQVPQPWSPFRCCRPSISESPQPEPRGDTSPPRYIQEAQVSRHQLGPHRSPPTSLFTEILIALLIGFTFVWLFLAH